MAWISENLPAMWDTQVQSLGQEGEGNGHPLQYSCLENSMDREAWWATIHGVAKNQTRQRLSLTLSLIVQLKKLRFCDTPPQVTQLAAEVGVDSAE